MSEGPPWQGSGSTLSDGANGSGVVLVIGSRSKAASQKTGSKS